MNQDKPSKSLTSGVIKTKNFLAFGDPDALIFFLAITGIFWGFWLAAPWEVFKATTTFLLMDGTLLSEMAWGFLFMSVHLSKLFFWAKYHRTGVPSWSQVASSFAMFILWAMVAATVILTNWQSTATPVYTFFSLASIWTTSQRLVDINKRRRILTAQKVEDGLLDSEAKGE